MFGETPLPHVWLGTSVEDQKAAEARIPALLDTPAAIRFLSCEPLLEPLDLLDGLRTRQLHWVIAGGESGPHARPCDLQWLRNLAVQCRAHRVPLFIKQLGSAAYDSAVVSARVGRGRTAVGPWELGRVPLKHPKGGDPEEWPAGLRLREWPEPAR
jgi:protein gp37